MSLINKALNKSRNDAGTTQNHVSLGAGADGAQVLTYPGGKGINKKKTSLLSISILGTILACTIVFYYVSNFTGLIPQLAGGKKVEIQLKDDIDFALYANVSKETAPVPLESAQGILQADSQLVEELVWTDKNVVAALLQVQSNDIVESAPSSVTNVMQPIQEGEKQAHSVHDSPPVEVQAEESIDAEMQIPEDEAEQEAQTLPESASGEQNNDDWYAVYHFDMGVFYQKNKELEKALEQYDKVIKLDPDNAEVHINLGVINKDKGDLDKAVEEYKKALAIDPRLEAGYNNLGVIYFLKGNYAEAIRHYQKAVENNPGNLESHVNLGIAYGIQKRSDEAERAFQTAISINPRHPETQYNLAVIHDENGTIEKALNHYSKFIAFCPATESELIEKVKGRIDVLSRRLKAKETDVR